MIFLASPYAHESESVRAGRAKSSWHAAGWLVARYREAVYPAVGVGHNLHQYANLGPSFADWTFQNDTMIASCEKFFILAIDGWDTSEGVTHETDLAITLRCTIGMMYPSYTCQSDDVHYSVKILGVQGDDKKVCN